jgi:alpha-tubulin suppressor-like RCC1 family protein
LTATATALPPITFTATGLAGPPTKLAVLTAPSANPSNRIAFDQQPTVGVQDANGNPVPQSGIPVTVSLTSGGGTLGGTVTVTTSSTGTAAFTGLAIAGVVGPRILTFLSSGLISATRAVTLTPGIPVALTLNGGSDQSALVGTAVPIPPSVKVLDADANAVSGVPVVFEVIGGGGSVTGANQSTDVMGIARVGSWILGPVAGTNTLAGRSSGLAGSPATFTASAAKPLGGLASLSTGSTHGHTCALTTGGTAYCWGWNINGQLGDGTEVDRPTPVAVGGGLMFESLVTGAFRTCGLVAGGAAFCWGSGQFGQLGNGGPSNASTPVPVSGGITFQSLASGGYLHICGLAIDGAAYCWGFNGEGQLGDGTTTERSTPVLVAGGLTFKSLAAGNYSHTCGVATTGTAYCWGSNINGQLGDGTTTNRLTPTPVAGGVTFESITAGHNYTCALTADGTAYCWGRNGAGELGDGTTTDHLTLVAVRGGLSFGMLIAGVGSANNSHTCGVTTGGAAYCWGLNPYGSLGDGSVTNQSSFPVAVSGGLSFQSLSTGANHTCGLTTHGTAYCWGYNGNGALGDGTTTNSRVPVPVRSP